MTAIELEPCKFCNGKVIFSCRPEKPEPYIECEECLAWWPWGPETRPSVEAGDVEWLNNQIWDHFFGDGGGTIDCSRSALEDILEYLHSKGLLRTAKPGEK